MELIYPIIADTNFLSDYLAGRWSAKKTMDSLIKESMFVITTTITVSELYYGKYKRKWQEKRSKILEDFISTLTIIPFNLSHAKEYGKIRASLVSQGIGIGFADVAIASIAIVERIPLLTANVDHFSRIKKLNIKEYKAVN